MLPPATQERSLDPALLCRRGRTAVTCLSVARRGPLDRLAARLRQDDALAQLARFVVVGASSTLLYALLFLSLHWMGYLPAHVLATVASSVVANDLHRRLTFH